MYHKLPCGIYWGFARIIQTNKDEKDNQLPLSATLKNNVYKTAISMGLNPVYKSEEKTIEPYLIASMIRLGNLQNVKKLNYRIYIDMIFSCQL